MWQSGGKRAVLEGRAFGCEIEIADNNPKLASLLLAPTWNHEDYADKLLQAFDEAISGRTIDTATKLKGQRARRRSVFLDKLRRLPSTRAIRARDAAKR